MKEKGLSLIVTPLTPRIARLPDGETSKISRSRAGYEDNRPIYLSDSLR